MPSITNGIFSSRYFVPALLVLSLLPLFFLNKTERADWGDDYIQFIYQSQHLFDARDYKVVVNSADHAPVKREVLFSLLLSLNKDKSLAGYKNIVATTYVVAFFLVFFFFRNYFNYSLSFLLVLCLAYNYRMLGLKNEVVAEFLFMIFLYSIFILERIKNKKAFYLVSLLFACLCHVRFAGIIFYLAFILSFILDRCEYLKWKDWLIHILIFCVVYVGIHHLLLRVNSGPESSFYISSIFEQITSKSIRINITLYFNELLYFFEQELPVAMNIVLKLIGGILITFGLFRGFKVRIGFIELSLVLYLLVLVVWPDQSSPTRYLAPIVPLFFFYLMKGLEFATLNIKNKIRATLTTTILVVILISNYKTILLMDVPQKFLGPFTKELHNDFEEVTHLTKETDIVCFTKPLVINLFCDRKSYALKERTIAAALSNNYYFLIPRSTELGEVYELNKRLPGPSGDTTNLEYFYLIKHRPR